MVIFIRMLLKIKFFLFFLEIQKLKKLYCTQMIYENKKMIKTNVFYIKKTFFYKFLNFFLIKNKNNALRWYHKNKNILLFSF